MAEECVEHFKFYLKFNSVTCYSKVMYALWVNCFEFVNMFDVHRISPSVPFHHVGTIWQVVQQVGTSVCGT